MTALVQRLHQWLHDRLATRAARVLATVVALAVLGAVGVPVLRVAFDLGAQRSAILAALAKCSAAAGDPAAVQLLQRGTVRVGDRDYGGPRMVGRAVDLFEDDGTMSEATKRELSCASSATRFPAGCPSCSCSRPRS